MNWVTIDAEKCNNCGICALRCPFCFMKRDDGITPYANEEYCNLCGHCVSLCPTGAIVHEKMDMSNFIDVGSGVTFEPDAFISFLRERRSHRLFKEKKIPQEVLERLVDLCRYSPTGGNVQTVEVIVVQNPDKRKRLSDLTIDFFIQMGEGAEKTLEEMAAGKGEGMADLDTLQTLAHYKNRLGLARSAGYDAIFYKAPAVMIFHSPANTRTPKDNCVIASTTMGLAARTMGLEATYIGLFEMASKMYEPITDDLGLPPGHEVFSVLIIGYPKLKFLRTVDRLPIKTRWE
jgi:nitroreductase/NAD-dependent dihydropyrimidine dehydrogenase PreA subunit